MVYWKRIGRLQHNLEALWDLGELATGLPKNWGTHEHNNRMSFVKNERNDDFAGLTHREKFGKSMSMPARGKGENRVRPGGTRIETSAIGGHLRKPRMIPQSRWLKPFEFKLMFWRG
jgi:hypothetical protein